MRRTGGSVPVRGGKTEPGHIAKYHCLTATSRNGFLTGSEEGRGPLFDLTHQPFEGDTAPTDDPVQGDKTGIPKNPGRHDLGLRATLVFPNREIVERYYVPIIYTACRTCYSEQDPDEIFRNEYGLAERWWNPDGLYAGVGDWTA